MQSPSPFRGHKSGPTGPAAPAPDQRAGGAGGGGGDPRKRKAQEEKERVRQARKREQETRRRQREARRRQRQAKRRERLKKKRAAREQTARGRQEKRKKRKQVREEKRSVRRARRQARRLALLLGLQVLARRFGRLVWPAYTRRLPRGKAVLVLLLNVAPFPGLGTVVYGKWERGLVQFALTFVFLLGWLWAVADGVRITARAFEPERRSQERARRVAARR